MAYYNGHQLAGIGANMTVVDDKKLKEITVSNEPYNNKKINDENNIVGYKGYKMIGYVLSSDGKSVDIELRDAKLDEKAIDNYAVGDKVNIEANTHLHQHQKIIAIKNSVSVVERYLNFKGGSIEEPTAATSIQTLLGISYPGESTYLISFETLLVFVSANSESELTELGYIVGRQYELKLQDDKLISIGLLPEESSDTNSGNTILTLEEVDGTPICFTLEDSEDESENWLYVTGKYVGEEIPQFSHAVVSGVNGIAAGYAAFAGGRDNKVYGNYGFAIGRKNVAAYLGVATGQNTKAIGFGSQAHGKWTEAIGEYSVALGDYSKTTGKHSIAVGSMDHRSVRTQANATNSVALGQGTIAGSSEELGKNSIATGYGTKAYGSSSLAVGYETQTGEQGQGGDVGLNAIAGGNNTKATGKNSVAFGSGSEATAFCSMAVGYTAKAYNENSAAFGFASKTKALNSFAAGYNTITAKGAPDGQAALGKYNEGKTTTIFEVGNGTSTKRANAFQVNSNGTATVQTDPVNAMDVATKQYVDRLEKEIETLKQAIINLGGTINV